MTSAAAVLPVPLSPVSSTFIPPPAEQPAEAPLLVHNAAAAIKCGNLQHLTMQRRGQDQILRLAARQDRGREVVAAAKTKRVTGAQQGRVEATGLAGLSPCRRCGDAHFQRADLEEAGQQSARLGRRLRNRGLPQGLALRLGGAVSCKSISVFRSSTRKGDQGTAPVRTMSCRASASTSARR